MWLERKKERKKERNFIEERKKQSDYGGRIMKDVGQKKERDKKKNKEIVEEG